MDHTLTTLFTELKQRANQSDAEGILRICTMIDCYLYESPIIETQVSEPLPNMSYEEVSRLIRPSRKFPKGSCGPSKAMIQYAVNIETQNARQVDRVIQWGKRI